METIRLTCARCNGSMVLEKTADYSRLSCPYCKGNDLLLVPSDPVRIAEIEAGTRLAKIEYLTQKHQDEMSYRYSQRKIQIRIICAVAVAVLVLAWIWLK